MKPTQAPLTRAAVLAAMLVCLLPARAADGPILLASLGKELHLLRAMPVQAPTHARCPQQKEALIGLTREAVRQALGEPDFAHGDAPDWTYFFTSPRSKKYEDMSFGGGFPELSFAFDRRGKVGEVFCSYAR